MKYISRLQNVYGSRPGDLEISYPTDLYIDVDKAIYQDLNPVRNGEVTTILITHIDCYLCH